MRILLAGILAGILIFVGGFLGHMVFGWVGRTISQLPDEAAMVAFFETQKLPAGVYGFPEMPKDFSARAKDEQEKIWKEIGERYKRGPSAFMIVAPAGEEMMSTSTLFKEFVSNVILGILMATILSLVPGGFSRKFTVALMLGFCHWLAINYSYHIWYRYPWPWVRDELFGAILESALAGVAIGLIVRDKKPAENA